VTNAQVDFALGTELRATYTVTPPGGTWDVTDDGVYTININRIEVSSTQDPPNDFAPAGFLTTFYVDLAPNLAPTVTGNSASGVGAGEAGDTSYSFTVEYSDDSGIDVSTIGIADVTITGPGGALTVTSAVGDTGAQLTPKTATYTVTPPGGDWDITDNGVYTISINASEVGDDDGTQLFVAADPSLTTFNVNVPSMAATLSSGNLEITQTNNPDSMLSLSVAGGILTVTDPGNTIGAPAGGTQVNPNTFTIPVASLTGGVINVTGGTGSDNLIVDTSVAAAGLRVVYEGGGGAGSDTLSLTGAAASVEHTFTTPNNGGVLLSGANFITYTGLEPVDDAITATDRTFSFLGAAETITLSNFGTPGESLIDSTLGESVNFVNPTGTLTINTEALGGSGVDIVNISGVDGAFAANLTVNAGTDDTINTGAVNIGAGILDLTGGQVNVNGAFIANGGVDIDSTLADISFGAAGSIDAGGNDIDLTATFNVESLNVTTTSEVRVTATGGGINDLTTNALITADGVALRAATGGVSGIDTDVNTLAAIAINGAVTIDNAGDLIIGTVDGLSGITANVSTVFLTTTGQLTVSNEVSAATIGHLRAIDAAAGVQDIIVNADITTLGGALTLEAGDNLNVATGVTLSSAGALNLAIDSLPGGVGDAAGGVANLNGILSAGGGQFITVTGGNDDDLVIIDGNGGAVNNGGNLDGIQSNFTFNGAGGSDELVVDDSGDISGDTIAIVNTIPGSGAVGGATTASLGYIGLEDLTVYTGTGADDITVNPNALTAIDITGNDPAAPTSPGDSLAYLTPPGESSTLTPDGLDGGTIEASGGFQDVVFDEIEGLTFGGSIVVNGTAGDDVLEITATSANAGSYQINGGAVINFTAATDFTFNGDDGDDILRINNPAGGLFNPVGGIVYNGQGQTTSPNGDTLEILGGVSAAVGHSFTNNSDGFVFYNGVSAITYTGLEPIIDNIDAANRVFSFTGGAETITLSDAGPAGSTFIDSDLGESVSFLNPTVSLTINTVGGMPGADVVELNGVDAAFDANLTVNGDTDDSVIFQASATDVGSGDVDVTAGSVTLNAAVTTTGDVSLDATNGSITGVSLVTATNATLEATVNAGGAGTEINLAVDALEADVDGSLHVDNTGALDIGFTGGITGVTVGGASAISSTDTMTVTENIDASGGTLQLENTGGNFVVNSGAVISNDGSNLIDIDSANGMSMLAGTQITSSGNGLIDIDAVFQIALANVNTSGEVQVTTTSGAIADNTAGEAALITANTLVLEADASIGGAGAADLNVNVNTLAASVLDGNGGGMTISNTGALEIGTVNGLAGISNSGVGGGNITLSATDTVTINEDIVSGAFGGAVTINSTNDIIVDAATVETHELIQLLADNDIELRAGSTVESLFNDGIVLTADADTSGGGSFTQLETSRVESVSGNVDVTAANNVHIADLRSGGGTITVTATNEPSLTTRLVKPL